MKGSIYTLAYAAVLGAVCALLLTGASQLTAPSRKANEEAEEIRNIIDVLDIPFDARASSKNLVRTFEHNVRQEKRGGLTLYLYLDPAAGKAPRAVAVPFAGSGLWGPVKGFLSLESDMKTIRDITFYEQEETPGLGGEIAAAWFRDQFKGKSIQDAEGKPGISILRVRAASASNEVDGITGATLTCDKVETILNTVIGRIVQERDRIDR